jgi:hypothetical protein
MYAGLTLAVLESHGRSSPVPRVYAEFRSGMRAVYDDCKRNRGPTARIETDTLGSRPALNSVSVT